MRIIGRKNRPSFGHWYVLIINLYPNLLGKHYCKPESRMLPHRKRSKLLMWLCQNITYSINKSTQLYLTKTASCLRYKLYLSGYLSCLTRQHHESLSGSNLGSLRLSAGCCTFLDAKIQAMKKGIRGQFACFPTCKLTNCYGGKQLTSNSQCLVIVGCNG